MYEYIGNCKGLLHILGYAQYGSLIFFSIKKFFTKNKAPDKNMRKTKFKNLLKMQNDTSGDTRVAVGVQLCSSYRLLYVQQYSMLCRLVHPGAEVSGGSSATRCSRREQVCRRLEQVCRGLEQVCRRLEHLHMSK